MKTKKIAHLSLMLAIDHMSGDWIVGPMVDIRDGRSKDPARDHQRVLCFTKALRLLIAYPELAATVEATVSAANPREQEKRFFTAITKFLEEADLMSRFLDLWPESKWQSLL